MGDTPLPDPSIDPSLTESFNSNPAGPRSKPSRGADGYYRIPTVAAAPRSTTAPDPHSHNSPLAVSVPPSMPTPHPVEISPATSAAPPSHQAGHAHNGGESVSGATNNPVSANPPHSGAAGPTASAYIGERAGEYTLGAGERPDIDRSPQALGHTPMDTLHGEKGALNASVPISTTPGNSPPPPGLATSWFPSRPPIELEMSTRPYRTGSSSKGKQTQSTFIPPAQGPGGPTQRRLHQEPTLVRRSGGKTMPLGSGGLGPAPRRKSPSRRQAPYPPPREQPAPPAPVRPRGTYIPQANAEAGPSNSRSAPERLATDYEGDAIMREAAEGLVQEQRRSLRGRAARSGLNAEDGEVVGGGSEMSLIAGVSASGRGVKIGSSVKIGTGPGGVQRKKTRGDVNANNQDFCSSCRGVGRFLCCDGCPRSFHFMCLEPPLRIDELPDEDAWYCKKCRDEFANETAPSVPLSNPSPSPYPPSASGSWPSAGQPPKLVLKPIPQTFRLLVKKLDGENPSQFRLPTDVREYFAGVGQDATGEYIEEVESRKADRKSFNDVRDLAIKEHKGGRPVACFVCSGSSVPLRTLATDPEAVYRQIVSCDYCALHWHLDCLCPPLTIVPNLNGNKKWMCPNHAEQVMPRRRTIRSGVETVDVVDLATPNNGNIEIVPERRRPQLDVEDILVNRRKYRVPEQIIQLDFFDKVKGRIRPPPPPLKKRRDSDSDSSLTSIADLSASTDYDDVEAANLIIGLATSVSGQSNGARPPAATGSDGTSNLFAVNSAAHINNDADAVITSQPPVVTTDPSEANELIMNDHEESGIDVPPILSRDPRPPAASVSKASRPAGAIVGRSTLLPHRTTVESPVSIAPESQLDVLSEPQRKRLKLGSSSSSAPAKSATKAALLNRAPLAPFTAAKTEGGVVALPKKLQRNPRSSLGSTGGVKGKGKEKAVPRGRPTAVRQPRSMSAGLDDEIDELDSISEPESSEKRPTGTSSSIHPNPLLPRYTGRPADHPDMTPKLDRAKPTPKSRSKPKVAASSSAVASKPAVAAAPTPKPGRPKQSTSATAAPSRPATSAVTAPRAGSSIDRDNSAIASGAAAMVASIGKLAKPKPVPSPSAGPSRPPTAAAATPLSDFVHGRRTSMGETASGTPAPAASPLYDASGRVIPRISLGAAKAMAMAAKTSTGSGSSGVQMKESASHDSGASSGQPEGAK